jgi:hypothetical protein
MTSGPNYVSEETVRRRSIDFIRKKWGSLGDLPKHVIPVVWVTTYRSLMKNKLIGDGQLAHQFEDATTKIEFLDRMISLLRSTPSPRERAIDGHVFVDVLKWGIDARSMSGLRRTIARQFAKADPEYEKPTPPELCV